MPILYVNEEHCTNLEQLRKHFEDSPSYGSPLFYDIIDYARSGDISSWLREKGETVLADQIDGIDQGLGDKEYFSRLSALMTGNNTSAGSIEKPDFSKCFHVEDVHQEKTSEGMNVHVRLKVLSSVNESYEFSVRTSWGQRGDTINPYHEEKDGTLTKSFFFRKRPNIKFKDITLLADGQNVAFKNVALLADGRELKKVQCTDLCGKGLEFEVNSYRFKMIRVEHGKFTMGASDGYRSERPVHKVTLTKDYYIGETPVTQKLWEAIMGDNPSYFKGDDLPVECISWNDCQTFIKQLNYKTGKTFRLPTEAEWEFAAFSGNLHGYLNGYYGWNKENSEDTTHPVKTKEANELGLYDMNGNVWEWCQDWYERYSSCNETNPAGPHIGDGRVIRGGSWAYKARCCSGTYRKGYYPDGKSSDLGFRLVLSE